MTNDVREIPMRDLKVRDMFKSRHSDTDVILDGDREVLRLTKKKKAKKKKEG